MVRTYVSLSMGAAFLVTLLAVPLLANAQTTVQNQLRAQILSEITSDPRSTQLSQPQLYSLVNALTLKADQQNLTAAAMQYRPTVPGSTAQNSSFFGPCSDLSCSLSSAFGLNGSVPLIPIALFVVAALFILIFGIMREMGHPHTQWFNRKSPPPTAV